jgi:hypothetical protein
MNREVVAINQDSLGIQGLKFAVKDGLEFWFKPLANNDWAFCILNRTTEAKQYTIDWQSFNLYDEVAKRFTDFDSKTYTIRNLWTKKAEGNTSKIKSVTILGHDVALYRLSAISKKK